MDDSASEQPSTSMSKKGNVRKDGSAALEGDMLCNLLLVKELKQMWSYTRKLVTA
jgi:hypothetical protein